MSIIITEMWSQKSVQLKPHTKIDIPEFNINPHTNTIRINDQTYRLTDNNWIQIRTLIKSLYLYNEEHISYEQLKEAINLQELPETKLQQQTECVVEDNILIVKIPVRRE